MIVFKIEWTNHQFQHYHQYRPKRLRSIVKISICKRENHKITKKKTFIGCRRVSFNLFGSLPNNNWTKYKYKYDNSD